MDQERIAHRPDGDGTAPVIVLEGRLPAWASNYAAARGVVVVSGALPEEQLLPTGSIASGTGFTAPDCDRRVWDPPAGGAGPLPGSASSRLPPELL